MSETVFVLKKHNGEYQCWHELHKHNLELWKEDGSLEDGDLVVYPRQIKKIEVIRREKVDIVFRTRREMVK